MTLVMLCTPACVGRTSVSHFGYFGIKMSVVLVMMFMFMILTVDSKDDMGADLDMESIAGGDTDSMKLMRWQFRNFQ